MTTVQRAFFELVRAGLWGTQANAEAFDNNTDWNQLYICGKNQTLLGIMLDGMQTLPEELRPPRALYLKWCASVLQTEENNRHLNSEVGKLFTLLRAHGVEPVLLKGQGVARNYRQPLHRQCGDIDIFIGKQNFELVNQLLRTDGEEKGEVTYKHSSYNWHNVIIENHRILTQMMSPRANRRLQQYIASWHGTDKAVKFNLEGYEVTVPPVEFDAIFLLFHAVHHLFDMGIGFRQICDWACLLRRNRESINRDHVAHKLTELKLDRTAKIFGALTVNCLGLDRTELPLDFSQEEEKVSEWLLDIIWGGGNFGKFDKNKKLRPKGYWRGKWHTFTTAFHRQLNFRHIAPSEAFWTPIMLITNLIQTQIYIHFRRNNKNQ